MKVAVRVADCPGLRVSGVVIPVAPNSEPATDTEEMVTGAEPEDFRTTAWVAVCPILTLPKLMVVVLRLSEGVPAVCESAMPVPFNPKRMLISAKM